MSHLSYLCYLYTGYRDRVATCLVHPMNNSFLCGDRAHFRDRIPVMGRLVDIHIADYRHAAPVGELPKSACRAYDCHTPYLPTQVAKIGFIEACRRSMKV